MAQFSVDFSSAPAALIFAAMSVTRELALPGSAGALPSFDPCLPRSADEPPAGPGWIDEIKHDGFRILAHRRGRSVRLITRNGHDLADRFPLGEQSGLRCERSAVRRSEGTAPLFGMALRRRLQRVVPFSWSSPVPECGKVVPSPAGCEVCREA